MKRFTLSAVEWLAIAITVYGILFGGSLMFWRGKFQESLVVPPQEDRITLLFAGDIMLDRGVEFYITRYNDWKWPFLLIADTLQKADLVFGNLESVISDKGENLGSMYSFRADPRAIEGLVFAGFDVLSVANNHSMDYSMDALKNSMNRLKEAGVAPVGIELFSAIAENNAGLEIRKIQGTKFGFLAYTNVGSPLWQATQTTPGVAWADWYNLSAVLQKIRESKTYVDILAVSLHAGEEYAKEPNEFQKAFAKAAINAGADVVVGHHPHVIQPVEQYKNGWIAYSLGNFVFDQGFSKETMEGLLLEVIVQDKKITQVIPRVIRLNSLFQPELP